MRHHVFSFTSYPPMGGGGGGGTQTIAIDGTAVHNTTGFAAALTITISTAGTSRAVWVSLNVAQGGALPSSLTVTSATLGTLVQCISSNINDCQSVLFFGWASTQLASEHIGATWVTSAAAEMAGIALTGAKNVTGLTPGTDYAVGTSTVSSTGSTVILIPKQANSWSLGGFAHRNDTVSSTINAGTSLYFGSEPLGSSPTLQTVHLSGEPLSLSTYTMGITYATSADNCAAAVEIIPGP